MLIGKLLAVVPRENETGDTKPQQSGGMKLHLQTTDVCVDRSGLECHYRLLTHTHTHIEPLPGVLETMYRRTDRQ
jgi:hypothetical protein